MKGDAVLFDLFDTIILIEDGEAFYTPCLKKLHRFLKSNNMHVPFREFEKEFFKVTEQLQAETERNLEEPHFTVRVSRVMNRFGYSVDSSNPLVIEGARVFAKEFKHYVRLDNNAREVLVKLHAEFKLGLITNFAIPECVRELLNEHNLEDFFDVILISGEMNKRKPNPEIFERALDILGVKASKAIFVGDTLDVDIKGAKKVGMKTILIDRRDEGEIYKVKPDKTIESLRELLLALWD